ncbi:hypothetical protein DFH09DRAFT_454652 [Mycena vulgaris]|nr:hypothetical protein DFH09DRAFT_454652 [Mycena vulgaris]
MLYKNWMVVRQPGAKPQVSLELSLPIRVMAFGVYVCLAMCLSLVSMHAPESPVPDLVIACAATVIILIFATQPDIIGVLCFWRKEPVTLVFNSSGSTVPV